MGNYKNYREPRRRGFDDDQPAEQFKAGGRPAFASPSPSPSGPPLTAIVKWFNSEKGFGFVGIEGHPDAFLHIRAVEAAGHESVPDGTTLSVRIAAGPKGPQVAEVITVDTSTAAAAPARRPPSARRNQDLGPSEEIEGVVQWYNPDKGFGFVQPIAGGKDIFVHARALQASGLTMLADGQRVVVTAVMGTKGPEARDVRVQGNDR